MLVLTRKKEQSIIIQDDIEITVIDVQKDSVRLGISAPKNIPVHRKEIYLLIKEENQAAANANLDTLLLSAKNLIRKH